MVKRKLTRFGIVLFVLVLTGQTLSQEAAKEPSFPFQIVKTNSKQFNQGKNEDIYVHLDEVYFSRQNLEDLFSHFSRNSRAFRLNVTVFSDKEMLQRQIRWDEAGHYHIDLNTKAGKDFYLSIGPNRNDFFGASYEKNESSESFFYSPKKNTDRSIKVVIKSSEKFENNAGFLLRASETGYLEAVRWLIRQRCQLNIKNDNGQTPLILAVSSHHNAVVKELIDSGADVNLVDALGLSPLHHAVAERNVNGVKLLIGKNANVNATDRDGKTPLMTAAANCDIESASLLIASGARVDQKDKSGKTARDYACDDKRLIELLSAKNGTLRGN